jgi:hypothetical protein
MRRGMKSSPFRQPMGDVVSDVANVASGGVGGGVSDVVDSLASLFGDGGVSSTDQQREASIYTLYEEAMTSPGSAASIAAVCALYSISAQIYDVVNNVQRNNPAVTRGYASTALQQLSTQGWTNVQSFTPRYTGVAASGVVYNAAGTAVASRPLSSLSTGELVIGGLVVVGLLWAFNRS